jgi:hypothetical protein
MAVEHYTRMVRRHIVGSTEEGPKRTLEELHVITTALATLTLGNMKVRQKTGLPNVLWLASIFCTYHDFRHLALPPLFVQRAVFAPLGVVTGTVGGVTDRLGGTAGDLLGGGEKKS